MDYELLVPDWTSKQGEWAPDQTSLAHRAAKMRRWLKDHPADEIIVVTHAGAYFGVVDGLITGFLLCLVQEIRGFENAECRSYTFAEAEEAILVPLSKEALRQ